MCGIAGFYGPYGEAELRAMTNAIAHRGPDDEGAELVEGLRAPNRVGLGHRRLSIIDLSSGHQPMWSADRTVGIVYNGEIYNYRVLRRELAAAGGQFRTECDTEVIVEGWRLWGAAILPRLEGMFAFGLWDARVGRWVLVRDRWGIKPLYYASPATGTLAFASEIRALKRLMPRLTLNRAVLHDYLHYSWTPGPETMFSGVRHIPPGGVLTWGPDGETLASFAPAARQQGASRASAAAELRERFDAAVTAHLVADVPVGVTLSGGLDSSAVLAGVVRSVPAQEVDAFTVGFGLADDETPFARRMAEAAGVRHHVRNVAKEKIAADFARIIDILEEPIAHPVLQTTYEAAGLAREHVKVTLIGEGSDELFLGYPQHTLLRAPFAWAPPPLLQRYYMAVACLTPTSGELAAMLRPEMRDDDLIRASAHRFDPLFRADAVAGAQAFEIEYPLVANQLARIDKLTMAHSLEARVPFLDNDFAAFARTLPVSMKLRGAVTKAVFRDAMRERLPPEILNRPKAGKGGTQALLPYLNRLLSDGPLASLISREAIGARGWFDPDRVGSYLGDRSLFVQRHPIESRRRAKFAYMLAVLEQWARIHLDGEARA